MDKNTYYGEAIINAEYFYLHQCLLSIDRSIYAKKT
jgi:hypothetical protein